MPGPKRRCLDGVSNCSVASCECHTRIVKTCSICGELRGRQSTKCCNSPVCKARSQHATNEKIAKWLAGELDATAWHNHVRAKLADWARTYLIEEAGWACTRCGWNTPHPKTGKPPLEIDHIDGNRWNNVRGNLVVLCPNCHALTPTYRRYNYRHVQELKKLHDAE
jgi:hypothetical protein